MAQLGYIKMASHSNLSPTLSNLSKLPLPDRTPFVQVASGDKFESDYKVNYGLIIILLFIHLRNVTFYYYFTILTKFTMIGSVAVL